MNLVLSGPVDDNLRNVVVDLSIPRNVVRLHARAYRLEGVDDSPTMRARVGELCDAVRVDHAYIEEGRRFSDFKLLAMDMDSTLITIECIDEIADFAGKKKEVAAITEAAMRGEIPDFAESLRRRVALLAGVPCSILARVFEERVRLTSGANQLLAYARKNAVFILLVSGGFTYFTERLRNALNLDAAFGNNLETADGFLTGRLIEPILSAQTKQFHVQAMTTTLNLTSREVLAIGDGANDIPMMEAAGTSIAFHAKPITTQAATHSIKHASLATLLDFIP